MKKRSLFLSTALLLVLSVVLAACGGGSGGGSSSDGEGNKEVDFIGIATGGTGVHITR